MPSEWTMEEAKRILYDNCGEIADTGIGRTTLAGALNAARAKGRREGLEEAAKIVDDWHKLYDGSTHHIARVACSVCRVTAADIRARLNQEPTS